MRKNNWRRDRKLKNLTRETAQINKNIQPGPQAYKHPKKEPAPAEPDYNLSGTLEMFKGNLT